MLHYNTCGTQERRRGGYTVAHDYVLSGRSRHINILTERDMPNEFKLKDDPYYPMSEYITGALERYLNHGIMPGSFMTAVLENNLKEAVARADNFNRVNLPNIVGYLWNHIPSAAWGSKEQVASWLEQFQED
jgi:hypothetical protein